MVASRVRAGLATGKRETTKGGVASWPVIDVADAF
jgi:hypothetical protein